ncbi:hypothetical protein P9911_008195 [Klebsiella oxytoca]|uniref:hypothetical protein n=1 Tax=Klebsiella oxytoca TaxID=571 RepID=UPI002550E691|nr:hypothetical protein [Klebsiella oxytoca]MEC5505818.1 hypothetical protein [Klebsiella oxytoca]
MTNNQLTETKLFLRDIQLGYMLGRSDIALIKAMAAELQERRKAESDSEPVAYTDERNLGYINRGRETAYLWGKQNSEPADVALYRHAQQPIASYTESQKRLLLEAAYVLVTRKPTVTHGYLIREVGRIAVRALTHPLPAAPQVVKP